MAKMYGGAKGGGMKGAKAGKGFVAGPGASLSPKKGLKK
jgi:hypothetical protein